MSKDDPRDLELRPPAAALAAVARRSLGQMSPAERARGLGIVRARLTGRRQRTRWALALGGLGVAAAALVLVPRIARRADNLLPALSYRIEGGVLGADGAIDGAAAEATPALRFGDGTVITLERGTKGRLAAVDRHGAHLAIADGAARVDVVPKPHARWQIDAGPFAIHVHGTVFRAAWDEATGKLDVRLERGLVSVEGPVTGGSISLHTGQRLTIALRQGRVLVRALDDRDEIRDDDAPAAETPAPSAAAPLAPPPAAAARAPGRPALAPAAAAHLGRTWTAALAEGDFAFIVEDAERDLPRALRSRSSEDLAALADAARYRRRDDMARRALEAQRRRFPRSTRAADAAFFLGRLDENDGAGLIHALKWYDRSLAEAPAGAYAAEALGRKMVALRELYGTAAARTVADDYVRRFPRGSYAGAAQALRGQTP